MDRALLIQNTSGLHHVQRVFSKTAGTVKLSQSSYCRIKLKISSVYELKGESGSPILAATNRSLKPASSMGKEASRRGQSD